MNSSNLINSFIHINLLGYDTGLFGAHQFHQERKDKGGQVNGRYGYTDPNGKLRLVYYTSGPQGYQAWGDLNPDGSPNTVQSKN